MGAWGVGIYDNDAAADWSAQVSESGLAAVEAAPAAVLIADYVESYEGACALAAADVVARLASGTGKESPYCEAIVQWVTSNPGRPSSTLLTMALAAVERVRSQDSELADLWSEGGASLSEWLATLADIEGRLLPDNSD